MLNFFDMLKKKVLTQNMYVYFHKFFSQVYLIWVSKLDFPKALYHCPNGPKIPLGRQGCKVQSQAKRDSPQQLTQLSGDFKELEGYREKTVIYHDFVA